MKTYEIFQETERLMKEYESAYKEAEEKMNMLMAKAEEAENLSKQYRDEAIQIEQENATIKRNYDNLRNIVERFLDCDFCPTEAELQEEKENAAKKEELQKMQSKPVHNSGWLKKKGEIGQFKPDGSLIETYSSQKSAAIGLRWGATSICKFMKLSRDNQIRKKGWYLEYMG